VQRVAPDGDAGHDLVLPALQPEQHPHGVVTVARLAQHLAVNRDDGVAADDDGILVARRHGKRLLAGQPLRVRAGLLAGGVGLVDVRGHGLDRQAEHAQQLRAAGRLRGEDDTERLGHGAASAPAAE
jgi:hypothetical protein